MPRPTVKAARRESTTIWWGRMLRPTARAVRQERTTLRPARSRSALVKIVVPERSPPPLLLKRVTTARAVPLGTTRPPRARPTVIRMHACAPSLEPQHRLVSRVQSTERANAQVVLLVASSCLARATSAHLDSTRIKVGLLAAVAHNARRVSSTERRPRAARHAPQECTRRPTPSAELYA